MSVSAVSGSVQLYPPVQQQPAAPVNAPPPGDASQTAAVQKQKDDTQKQQVQQVQQVQNQNDNQISVNFLV